MSRVRDWRVLLALPAKLLRRRRSLQAPEGAPATPALSGSALAVRRDLAMVKASEEKPHERQPENY
jgi:hypothetical protein